MSHHRVFVPLVYTLTGCLLGGLIVFGFAHHHGRPRSNTASPYKTNLANIRQNNTAYTFIKPLLNSEYDTKEESAQLYPYLNDIQSTITDALRKHPQIVTGVYYRDLTNSAWTGVHEDDKFVPASLLKVPMIISYYKLQETEPTLFDEKIIFNGQDLNNVKNLGEPGNIRPGNTYTVKELLHEMIVNSDNNALELLYQFRKDALPSIFQDLDTPLPSNRKDIALTDYLSPQEDSKFFVVLYNASYLDRKSSEEVLHTLSETNFKDGIVAGSPPNTLVSHKFGERVVEENGIATGQEFHDCGIIYYPGKPYFLCVMTKGNNLADQEAVARDVSSEVFKVVSAITTSGK